ncbi:MAG: FkbM family methyltransferase, partial [Synechococcaceae cyanobacterium]|nr:FkbM family methyltransferase [Synechococcaceae cyanobacterium]
MIRYLLDRLSKKPRLRRFLTRMLVGSRTVDVDLLGTRLRVHSIKEHGYLRASRMADRSTLFRGEVPVMINLAALLEAGDTFIDIGANVGIYCLAFERLREIIPGLRIYAFEPNPDTYERLRAMAEPRDIETFNLALSDHDGMLEFTPGGVSLVFTRSDRASAYSLPRSAPVSVPCRRLDGLGIAGDSL